MFKTEVVLHSSIRIVINQSIFICFFLNIGDSENTSCTESQPEAVPANATKDSKPGPMLPSTLRIGQVVIFDAICVIDTAASAVSRTSTKSQKGAKIEREMTSQVNTSIAVKKVIYMIATKVTRIDHYIIGGMSENVVGMNLFFTWLNASLKCQNKF